MTVCNVTHLLPHGGTDLMGPQHDYASFGNDKWEMENLHSKRTLHVDHFYNRLDFALRNKRRPVSYNLFDLGPAAGETSDSWRAGQNQRRNLFRETLYRAFVISPHPHAQLHLRQIRGWRACQWTMRRARAHKLRQHLIEAKTKSIQSRTQDPVSRLRLVVCIRPGVHKCPDSLVARRIANGNFQRLGCPSAFNSIDANTVAAFVIQMHGGEIRNAIRRNVFARIAHLINQLFFDRGNNYPSAGAFMFGNNKGSIGRCLDNRETYPCEIRNAAPLI